MSDLAVGDRVRCNLPGRRTFESTVIRVGDDAVDLVDPRNGGIRTIRVERVRPVRRRRKAAA